MTDDREIVVLLHDDLVPPAGITALLDSRAGRRAWRLVAVGDGEPLPAASDVAGIVALGGRMGMADRDDHAWMTTELDLLRTATDADTPVLGICLGAQLLADALGGTVETRSVPEVGYLPMTRTSAAHDDDVFGGWPDGAVALMVHKDEVAELPGDAQIMLTGAAAPAGWRIGRSYAVQFHPEIDPDLLAAWLAGDSLPASLERAGVDGDDLLDETRRRAAFLRATGLAMVGRWLDTVVK